MIGSFPSMVTITSLLVELSLFDFVTLTVGAVLSITNLIVVSLKAASVTVTSYTPSSVYVSGFSITCPFNLETIVTLLSSSTERVTSCFVTSCAGEVVTFGASVSFKIPANSSKRFVKSVLESEFVNASTISSTLESTR